MESKKNGWGGARPGAGRKPKVSNIEVTEHTVQLFNDVFRMQNPKHEDLDSEELKQFFAYFESRKAF